MQLYIFGKFIIPYIVTFVHRQPFQRDMENDEFDVRKTKPFFKNNVSFHLLLREIFLNRLFYECEIDILFTL